MAREYTDVDKRELLIEVAKYNGSSTKAQKATGVHNRVLQRWWDALTEDERHDFMLEAKKRQEAYWQDLHDVCLQVARDKVSEMSARDALIGAGISFDKLRLIRGEATDISGTLSSDADALAREVEGILSKVTVDASREAITQE
jgi:hypothetical protein